MEHCSTCCLFNSRYGTTAPKTPTRLITNGVLHHHLHVTPTALNGKKHIKVTNTALEKDVSMLLPVEIVFEMIVLLKMWFKKVKCWTISLNSSSLINSTTRLENYCRRQQFCTVKVGNFHDDLICRYHTVTCPGNSTVVIVLKYLLYDHDNERRYTSPIMNVSMCKYTGVECDGALNFKGQKEFALLLHILKECARDNLEERQDHQKLNPLLLAHQHDNVPSNREVMCLFEKLKCVECERKAHCKPIVVMNDDYSLDDSTGSNQGGVNHSCCFICNKSFRQKAGLKLHLSRTQCMKRFKCMFCTSQFKHQNSMQAHLERVHSMDLDELSDITTEMSNSE
jgi:hypothetical protein